MKDSKAKRRFRARTRSRAIAPQRIFNSVDRRHSSMLLTNRLPRRFGIGSHRRAGRRALAIRLARHSRGHRAGEPRSEKSAAPYREVKPEWVSSLRMRPAADQACRAGATLMQSGRKQVMRILKFAIAAALACGVATAAQAQQVRVIASNPQGSIFYAASVAIGKLMDDKLKMQVRVQPMAGSSTYIPLLNRGEVDFGLTNVDDALHQPTRAIGNFRQAEPQSAPDRDRVSADARRPGAERLADQDHRRPQGQDHALGLQRPDHRPRPAGGRARQRRPHHERRQDRADPEPVLRRRSARRRQGRCGRRSPSAPARGSRPT